MLFLMLFKFQIKFKVTEGFSNNNIRGFEKVNIDKIPDMVTETKLVLNETDNTRQLQGVCAGAALVKG